VFVTAGDLRRDCNAQLGDRSANFQRCLWYIAAIHDTMQDAGPIKGRTACFPPNLIVGNLVQPVVEFIDRLPDPNKVGAGATVVIALATAYPCAGRPKTA
jgi:hypothetical protein